jgi:hypothetical protein
MSDGLLGNMLVKIIGDKTSLDAALDAAERKTKTTEARINAQLNKIGDGFIKTGKALTIGLTAPLIAAGAAAIKFGSDTTESLNAASVVFKDSTGKIKEWGSNAAEMAGLSSAEFYQAAAVLGAGLINAGASAETASEQTIELTKRAADMASIFNTSVNDALVALQSGLRGESEPLRRFAVTLDEASIKAKAVAMGLSDTESNVSAYAKSQARLAIILEQTSRFQGDFVNTSGDAANSSRILGAQLKETASNFGQTLMPVVKDVVSGLRAFVGSLMELDEGQRGTIITFGLFAAAAGPVALGVGTIIKALTSANPTMRAFNIIMTVITIAITAAAGAVAAFSVSAAKAKKETELFNDALAMTADISTTQKALDEVTKKIEKLQIVMRASPNSEAFKKQLEVLEAQKATLESNIASISRLAQAKKEEAIVTEGSIKVEDKQVTARKAAKAAYDEAMAQTENYYKNGLIPVEEKTKQTTDATITYAKALIDAGYRSTESSIGGQALARALSEIPPAAVEASKAMRDVPPLSPLDPEAVRSLADFDTFLAEFRERRRAEEAEESAALAKKKAEETAYLDIIKNGLNETNGAFVALGEAFVTGENPAKAFFKTLIGTIGDAVIAFAALTEAQGWATWPLVDWAKVIKGAALAVLGGTVKAAAASLASGGIASGPTLAVVGDNPYADEMVAPLTPDTFRGFADGLLNALAERSRPAGVTEATVASATISGSSGAGSTINLHVGTLIADDAGMRKLNRELRKFGLQENVRTGYGG